MTVSELRGTEFVYWQIQEAKASCSKIDVRYENSALCIKCEGEIRRVFNAFSTCTLDVKTAPFGECLDFFEVRDLNILIYGFDALGGEIALQIREHLHRVDSKVNRYFYEAVVTKDTPVVGR